MHKCENSGYKLHEFGTVFSLTFIQRFYPKLSRVDGRIVSCLFTSNKPVFWESLSPECCATSTMKSQLCLSIIRSQIHLYVLRQNRWNTVMWLDKNIRGSYRMGVWEHPCGTFHITRCSQHQVGENSQSSFLPLSRDNKWNSAI